MPLLDTKLLSRLASGLKHESYYPVAVADNKFHCIILKGGDQYPYFPRPLLSEFDFSIPLTSAPKKKAKKPKKTAANGDGDDLDVDGDNSDDDDQDGEPKDEAAETRKLEQQYLLKGIQAAQLADVIDAETGSGAPVGSDAKQLALSRLELEIDKALLQMVAVECREGEDRGMRALEMVALLRDRTGRTIEAAGKVAERYGRSILGDKIREMGEARVQAMDEDF